MKTTMRTWVSGAVMTAALVATTGCLFFGGGTKVKPPTLQMTGLKYAATGLTGAKLNVTFSVRNVNPTPLVVESFRYELELDKTSLGTGFYPTRMELAGMAEQKVSSIFDLNYVKVPAAIQSLLQQDHVHARVNCKFFLAGGRTMSYKTEADVQVQK